MEAMREVRAGVGGGTRLFRDQGELHEEITRTRTAGFGDEVRVLGAGWGTLGVCWGGCARDPPCARLKDQLELYYLGGV